MLMSIPELSNLQAELSILTETIEYFKSINYYPSTYLDLVNRYNELTQG
jgi:hypothetical protein